MHPLDESENHSIVLNLVRNWWMLFWRLTIFFVLKNAFETIVVVAHPSPIIGAAKWAIIFTLILNFGLNRTLSTWPLIKLIAKRDLTSTANVWEKFGWKTPKRKARNKARSSSDGFTILEQASEAGKLTGFEPRMLDLLPIPRTDTMFGNPGAGLSSSGFADKSIQLGQEGELRFAKALAKAEMLDRFVTFWSVAMPTKFGRRDPDFQADIDCVIYTGTRIYLVDLKNYKQGNVFYKSSASQLTCIDRITGHQVGPAKRMTQNNSMALERVSAFAGLPVEARVVFMPTNKGMGSVKGVLWPGRIPAITLDDFLAELRRQPEYRGQPSNLISTFQGLLKD
jgi:hypothetical protein